METMSEESVQDHSSQFSLDFARKEGLRIVLPSVKELQIDIDNDADFAQFTQAYSMLRDLQLFSPRGYSERPSRNGGEGRHITVMLHSDVTPLERITLQAILGSDWRREMFSLKRLEDGDAIPTLFFEKVVPDAHSDTKQAESEGDSI